MILCQRGRSVSTTRTPTESLQRVVAYHAGSRRDNLTANEDGITAEAARGIKELTEFLARQPVLAYA